jgi:hypothetical protein
MQRPCRGSPPVVARGHDHSDLFRLPLPRDVIQRAVWMYLRFTLSYRDVEDLLAERGIEVSYEGSWRGLGADSGEKQEPAGQLELW